MKRDVNQVTLKNGQFNLSVFITAHMQERGVYLISKLLWQKHAFRSHTSGECEYIFIIQLERSSVWIDQPPGLNDHISYILRWPYCFDSRLFGPPGPEESPTCPFRVVLSQQIVRNRQLAFTVFRASLLLRMIYKRKVGCRPFQPHHCLVNRNISLYYVMTFQWFV